MEKKTNNIMCCQCKYACATSDTEKSFYCDNSVYSRMVTEKWIKKGKKTALAKSLTHGRKFSCGYGRMWNESEAVMQ